MRVTIIGPGKMGRGIATRLVNGGHTVAFVGKDRSQAEEAVEALQADGVSSKGLVAAADPAEAVGMSDVVILALPFQAAIEEAGRRRDLLGGKVVIDISNPLNESYSALETEGGPSAAERIRERLPAGARLVKAFNTVFAPTLVAGNAAGKSLDVFVAGDDQQANETVADLVRSSGMRPILVGPLERARQLEGLAFLGIAIQEPLGLEFQSGWKLLMPADQPDDDSRPQFPRDAVVGAIEPGMVERALADLEDAGVDSDRVEVVAGPDAERRIRDSMERGSRPLEFLFGFESEHSRRHLVELRSGHSLVVVWVDDGNDAERIGGILARHGGHFINYYSRWTSRTLAT